MSRSAVRIRLGAVAVAVLGLVASACGDDVVRRGATSTTAARPDRADSPERLGLRVVATVPHRTPAFTEGLVFDDGGRLFESTGLYGSSEVRELDPTTGEVLRSRPLDATVFGEGLAVGPDGLVQLTWRESRVYRWGTEDLAPQPGATIDGEGWGLTSDPRAEELIRSDGTATLTRHAAGDLAVRGTVDVREDGRPVDELNELELVGADLYANVWHRDDILRIDPASGRVSAVIDASGLWPATSRGSEDVLNGIAHRPGDPPDRLWLTGKNWPELYVVDVVAR